MKKRLKILIKDAMISISSSEHHMFSIPLEVSINSGIIGERHIRRLNFDINFMKMII